jgi:catechol 2,3-dioxygenase-like lactoylglutathione lyase family enzyme
MLGAGAPSAPCAGAPAAGAPGAGAPPAGSPPRPAITALSHVAVFTGDAVAAGHFYGDELGAVREDDPEISRGVVYRFSASQWVEVLPLPAQPGTSRLDHVAFATADAAGLRRYLLARGCAGAGPLETAGDGSRRFLVLDPEGNRIEFVQSTARPLPPTASPVSRHIIHAGFLVRDRAAEEGFYRDLLGFRPYWHGGMAPGRTDWVSFQVPEGRDWLEFMLTGPGSTTPDAGAVGARQLGVMNHLSLGVPNMEAAVTALYVRDGLRSSPRHDGPQMGRDGKWQTNLYDPDGTRVELMEFQPVIPPCCSPFTAPNPTR